MESRMSESPRLQAFEEWFVANGGYINPSAEVSHSELGNYVSVRPKSNTLEPGSTIVSCPRTLTISFANVRLSPVFSTMILNVGIESIDRIVLTRLFLMEQYLLGKESFWWPYLQILPQPDNNHAFHTPLWYEAEDLLWLQGTNLGKATVARQVEWKREFEDAMRYLCTESEQRFWTWYVRLAHFLDIHR